jgi:dTDP-4-dehydrorhamnose reductase
MRVLVTGGSGQLARALRQTWTGVELVLPEESELDLADREAIRRVLDRVRPEVVINAGAFTQVDRCETEVDRAMLVNGTAVGWLAAACTGLKARLVQISTDYVFDGRAVQPYGEDDPVNPLSVYGKSKLMGEQAARTSPGHLIVRTAWLYDAWGANFHATMLQLARQGRALTVVDDQRGAPTTCRALARQLRTLLDSDWSGTLHATCAGETTWFGFAAEIFRQHELSVDLSPCTTEAFPRPAPRPAYSVLSGERRRALGLDVMPDWREALAEVTLEAAMQRNGVDHD